MKGNIRSFIVVFSGLAVIVVSSLITNCSNSLKPDARGEAYANETTCRNCHKDIAANYLHTAHYRTSSLIDGTDLPAANVANAHTFIFNDSLKIKIEKRSDGWYQVAYANNQKVEARRFDVAFGANVKAQTYGYWDGNKLNELPLSFFKAINDWANSPGFPATHPNFDRPIISRCLECHASFVEKKYVQSGRLSVTEEFDKASVMYGINCQRCHGPAQQHVDFQTSNPQIRTARYMLSYTSLNKQQKINMCAVCHGGSDVDLQRSTFGYKPGDDLASFYDPFGRSSITDVHGNQAKLLSMSKCYLNSATLTCTTCHNVHQQEVNDPAIMSQKCMACHQPEMHNFCKLEPQLGKAINTKCIDCHMPETTSRLISFRMSAKKQLSAYQLHTHIIAIYPGQTKQILAYLSKIKPAGKDH